MNIILILLVLFQLKHFLADYPLQGKYMLGKFQASWDFFNPLVAHVLVHGLITFTIAMFINWRIAPALMLFDMVVHFAMDRLKAGPKYLGRFKPLSAAQYVVANKQEIRGNTFFWWSLGLDQMVHHLTHYAIIWMLIR